MSKFKNGNWTFENETNKRCLQKLSTDQPVSLPHVSVERRQQDVNTLHYKAYGGPLIAQKFPSVYIRQNIPKEVIFWNT
jgi:hypothetical protein